MINYEANALPIGVCFGQTLKSRVGRKPLTPQQQCFWGETFHVLCIKKCVFKANLQQMLTWDDFGSHKSIFNRHVQSTVDD